MKYLKFSFLSLLLSAFFMISHNEIMAQQSVQADTAKNVCNIKVAFHCPNGKALIEKELIKETGVRYVVADLETKIVTVRFDPVVTNKEKIVTAIENIGYATEFTPADKKINKACSHH